MPGDTLYMRDGVLYLNGIAQRQGFAAKNYNGDNTQTAPNFDWQHTIEIKGSRFGAPPAQPTLDNWGPLVIPADHYFMMGDNRYCSKDSRYWGVVPKANVRGRPLFVYYSYVPGPRTDDEPMQRADQRSAAPVRSPTFAGRASDTGFSSARLRCCARCLARGSSPGSSATFGCAPSWRRAHPRLDPFPSDISRLARDRASARGRRPPRTRRRRHSSRRANPGTLDALAEVRPAVGAREGRNLERGRRVSRLGRGLPRGRRDQSRLRHVASALDGTDTRHQVGRRSSTSSTRAARAKHQHSFRELTRGAAAGDRSRRTAGPASRSHASVVRRESRRRSRSSRTSTRARRPPICAMRR